MVFKNAPRKHQAEWEIIGVENNPRKVNWSKGGYPNFVHLRRKDKPNQTCWTCSNQLQSARFK